jgi:hypothetical protein
MRRISLNNTDYNSVVYSRTPELGEIQKLKGKSTTRREIEYQGKTYNSIREASRDLGIPVSTIRYRLNKVKEKR